MEVALCGQGIFAAAYVIFNFENYGANIIHFQTIKNTEITVSKRNGLQTIRFPHDRLEKVSLKNKVVDCFEIMPKEIYMGKSDYLVVFNSEEEILSIKPDFNKILNLDCRAVIVSAKGNKVDFVSRFFMPKSGLVEDAATGSSHPILTKYWSDRLNKNRLTAIQLSERKGYFQCEYLEDGIEITSAGNLYLKGKIYL